MPEHYLGIDTGGTFTDFAYLHKDQLITYKRLSTPAAPEEAILAGIEQLGLVDLCQAGELTIIHGTTVATNAALEGKGVKTAYVCNKGLGDILELGRQDRSSLYQLMPSKARIALSPEAIFEINVRRSAKGELSEPLTTNRLEDLKTRIEAFGSEAAAINLLHSYLNPTEEMAIADYLGPEIFVSQSSKILPEMGEYERGVATYLNASLGPLVAHYLKRLAAAVAPSQLAIMQSSGLTLAASQAATQSVRLLLSGPAGGLIGTQNVLQAGKIMTFDMGGTSTDVSLIDEDLRVSQSLTLGGLPIPIPAIDIETIGAGGGSIATIDPGGLLQVGPESAGADPGPACYGQGGSKPTVTDANVVLGRLPTGHRLAGDLVLHVDLARAAVSELGAHLNLSMEETALGIILLANERMAEALRRISIQRGYDPTDFSLCCFGGAGGLHLCDLCDLLDIKRALVPAEAGIFSALGMLVARPGRERSQGIHQRREDCSDELIAKHLKDLIKVSRQELAEEGVVETEHQAFLDIRYLGQTQTLSVAYQQDLILACDQFEQQHKALYGHRLDAPTEIVSVRVRVTGAARLTQVDEALSASSGRTKSEGLTDGSITIQKAALAVGQPCPGPMIVIDPHTTIWVAEGWQIQRLATNHLELTRLGDRC